MFVCLDTFTMTLNALILLINFISFQAHEYIYIITVLCFQQQIIRFSLQKGLDIEFYWRASEASETVLGVDNAKSGICYIMYTSDVLEHKWRASLKTILFLYE